MIFTIELDEKSTDYFAMPSIKSKNGELEENCEEMFNSDGLCSSFGDSLHDIDGDSLLMEFVDANNDNSRLGSVAEEETIEKHEQ